MERVEMRMLPTFPWSFRLVPPEPDVEKEMFVAAGFKEQKSPTKEEEEERARLMLKNLMHGGEREEIEEQRKEKNPTHDDKPDADQGTAEGGEEIEKRTKRRKKLVLVGWDDEFIGFQEEVQKRTRKVKKTLDGDYIRLLMKYPPKPPYKPVPSRNCYPLNKQKRFAARLQSKYEEFLKIVEQYNKDGFAELEEEVFVDEQGEEVADDRSWMPEV